MPLSEIQKKWMTQDVLYRNLMSMNSELDNTINNARNRLEFLEQIDATDLTEIGIPSETQTLLGQMRTSLASLIDSYDSIYAAIADKLRMI